MKKRFFCMIIALMLCFACASGAYAETGMETFTGMETQFTLRYYAHGDGTVDLEIHTDKPQGVGGMHIEVSAEQNMWEIDASQTKAFIKSSYTTADKTHAAFVWETASGDELPEKLFQTTLHAKTSAYDISGVYVQVLEYYDNTLGMNDLGYSFQVDLLNGKAKPIYNIWLLMFSMLLLLAAVLALFSVSIRWRYAAWRVLTPLIKRMRRFLRRMLRRRAVS